MSQDRQADKSDSGATGTVAKPRKWLTPPITSLWQLGKPIAAFSAGSPGDDLSKEWGALSSVWKVLFIVLPIAVIVFALYLLLCLVFNFPKGTILLYARTEHLQYVPITEDPPRWVIPKEASFRRNGEAVEFEGGSLELSCGDRVTLNRIGMGNMQMHVDIADGNELGVVGTDEEYLESFHGYGGTLAITIPDIQNFQTRGVSVNWPMTGLIIPGRPVKYEVGTNRGLLLSGTLQVIARYLFSDDQNFILEEMKLKLGDQIVLDTAIAYNEKIVALAGAGLSSSSADSICVREGVTDKGFVNFDSNSGFNVAMSSETDTGEINRYNTTSLKVGNNWIKRLLNDKWYSLGWTVVFLFFAGYRKVVRSVLARKKFAMVRSDQSDREPEENQPSDNVSDEKRRQ